MIMRAGPPDESRAVTVRDVAALLDHLETLDDAAWLRLARTTATPGARTAAPPVRDLDAWVACDKVDTIAWLRFGRCGRDRFSRDERGEMTRLLDAIRDTAAVLATRDSRSLHEIQSFLYAIFTA